MIVSHIYDFFWNNLVEIESEGMEVFNGWASIIHVYTNTYRYYSNSKIMDASLTLKENISTLLGPFACL